VAVALQGFFIIPLVITDTIVDCDSNFLIVNAACEPPPLSPSGPPSALMLLPRVVSHPEAPRTAGVLVTGSLDDEDPKASGWASTLGLGWPPPAAALALRPRAAGTTAHDTAATPRAVRTRLPTCAHIGEFDVTCNFTASAQASSPRSREERRTRRRKQNAASIRLKDVKEA
jgi:hypothetical protein